MSLSTHLLEVGPIDDPRPVTIHLPECPVDEGAAGRVEVATHHDDELIKVQLLAVLNTTISDPIRQIVVVANIRTREKQRRQVQGITKHRGQRRGSERLRVVGCG